MTTDGADCGKTHKRLCLDCFYSATPPCKRRNLKYKEADFQASLCVLTSGASRPPPPPPPQPPRQEEHNQSVRLETPRRRTLPASRSPRAFPFILGTFLDKVPWLLSPLRRPLIWPEASRLFRARPPTAVRLAPAAPPGVGQQQPDDRRKTS